MDDLPNSPNFSAAPPNFSAIQYARESIEVVCFANESLEMQPANVSCKFSFTNHS